MASNYKIKVPPVVSLIIKKLHPQIKQKIRHGFEAIVENPYSGKPLKNELEGLWSFKVGRYRIIYRFKKMMIELIAIGPRSHIYQSTYQVLKKDKQF